MALPRVDYANLIFGKTDNNDYRIATNEWVDVAFVVTEEPVGNHRIDMYMMQESGGMVDGAWRSTSVGVASKYHSVTTAQSGPSRVGSVGATADKWKGSGDKGNGRAFAGSFSQLAIWPRALSQGEIAEAFGGNALKFEFGVENGLSSEFAGTGATVVANVTNAWRHLPPALTAEKPSVSIDFDIPAYEAGLPQTLRFLSTPSSPAGVLALSLNGAPVAEDVVTPGKATMFDILKDRTVVGKNTLTLTWKGSGTLGIDAIACGGSWQLGYDDSSYAEFMKSNRYRKTYYLAGPQTWNTRCNRHLYASNLNYADNTIVFSLPEGFTANRRYQLDFRCYRNVAQVPPTLKITLNGVEKITQSIDASSPGFQTVSVPLAEGALLPGVNSVRFDSVPGATTGPDYAIYFDYLRLTVRRERKGLQVLVK